MSESQTPDYYRIYADVWRIAKELGMAQGGKLLFALCAFFFDGAEPDQGRLPKDVRRAYQAMRPQLKAYRRNVQNGSKNRKNAGRKRTKTHPEKGPETTAETATGFQEHSGDVPADMHEAGTHPEANPTGQAGAAVGTTINNQESIISMRGASHAPRAAHTSDTQPIIDTHSVLSKSEYDRMLAQTSGAASPEGTWAR